MTPEEINVLASITGDVANLARRIEATTGEFNRLRRGDEHDRTLEPAYDLALAEDALNRAGKSLLSAIAINDRVLAEARRKLEEEP